MMWQPPVPEEDEPEPEIRGMGKNLRQAGERVSAGPASKRPPAGKANAKPPPDQRYVRRKFGFQRMDGQTLVAGEKVYKRQGNAFVRVGRVKPAK
jgi:hypothetical protein